MCVCVFSIFFSIVCVCGLMEIAYRLSVYILRIWVSVEFMMPHIFFCSKFTQLRSGIFFSKRAAYLCFLSLCLVFVAFLFTLLVPFTLFHHVISNICYAYKHSFQL